MNRHVVGYAKSDRAKCHAPPPCQGSRIDLGTLRYGSISSTENGETVSWRHWGCVTRPILAELASVDLNKISGFSQLKASDQMKIRVAVAAQQVHSADIPASAKSLPPPPAPPTAQNQSQSKRKASEPASTSSARSGAAPSTMASSQAIEIDDDTDNQDEAIDELYTTLRTNVVGIQYYTGLVGPGEEVSLRREPHNKYDRNAIQVINISGTQVGHIPKQVASRLAPLLDRRLVTVEGIIHDGNLSGAKKWQLDLSVKIFASGARRAELEPQLVWATLGQRGFASRSTAQPLRASQPLPGSSQQGTAGRFAQSTGVNPANLIGASQSGFRGAYPVPGRSQAAVSAQARAQAEAHYQAQLKQQEALAKAAELRQMLNSLEKVDDEGRRSTLLDTLCATEDILKLPEHAAPPGISTGQLKVDLLKHQKQGLQWCIEREYPTLPKKETDKPKQFWKLRKLGNHTHYYNLATKTPQTAEPVLGRGALFADAMGLGKTLTMLALVIATLNDKPARHSKSTLIVCPLSVLSNWQTQIEDHCTPGTLTVCTYYGSTRSMSAIELAKYDVVLTTYQAVAGEHGNAGRSDSGPSQKKKKVSSSLFEVQWKRIVLDEGHTIRNPRTKTAKALCALEAQRRWVLTGTPIINSPQDLGSLLTFLQICKPLDSEDYFKRLLLRPLKNGEASGADLLKGLMAHICLRRTKEMQDSEGNPLVPLPPVDMTVIRVELGKDTRELYDQVEQASKERFEGALQSGMNVMVQSNVLSMLTRLRQIALHPGLVPELYLEELRAANEEQQGNTPSIVVTPEVRVKMNDRILRAIEECEECAVCMNVMTDPRVTPCSHVFCLACIKEVITRNPACPLDRRPIGIGDIYEPPPPTDLTQRPSRPEVEHGFNISSSAKIEQLIHLLSLNPSNEKSLVFSQFTSFLDKIADALDEKGIPYVRFDGQMSAKRRQETIAQFSVPIKEDISATQATSRRRSRSNTVVMDGIEDDNGSDYAPGMSDDDFDMPARSQKSQCKRNGKGKARKEAVFGDYDGVNPKVMLISLKAGALGLNLTVANNVYLMDPWWQEGIESQAIDRVNRIGQKKPVHVYQLIADNTVEAKVLDIQNKKKMLIKEAFSGVKRVETQRQQREARLQDLIDLFGVRQQQD